MKKLSYLFLLFVGVAAAFVSCDDDDPTPSNGGAPTISVTPTTASGIAGASIDFNVTATAGTGGTVASVTANDGSGAVTVSGTTYSYSIDAGATLGSTITINFIVTDDQSPAQTATTTATVTVGKTMVNLTSPDIDDATLVDNTVYNMTANVEYLMDGLVFLEEGSELNIEAGTVIKFKATPTSDNASSLIITRGAKIFANGTATDPIIFTAEADDLTGNSLTPQDNGQWGGLLILGNATSEKSGNSEIQIEGIDSGEPRGLYGNTTPIDDDSSGELTYVSIRYTGIGFQPGDELQGLTLGGVGSGTTIDYVDIFSSADDGIEIFGGTVDIKHISVAFSTDDDFDFDLGWRGKGQFLFSLMLSDASSYDHAGEWDGASPDDGLNSMPELYNCTFIGPGTAATGRDKALLFRENFAGTIANSVLVDFPANLMEVQDLTNGVGDSYGKLGTDLNILNNTWSNFNGAGTLDINVLKITSKDGKDNPQTPDDPNGTALITHLTDNNNKVEAAVAIKGISRAQDNGLDPNVTAADTDVATLPAGFDAADYRGAFDPATTSTWLDGWSSLSKFGYLVN